MRYTQPDNTYNPDSEQESTLSSSNFTDETEHTHHRGCADKVIACLLPCLPEHLQQMVKDHPTTTAVGTKSTITTLLTCGTLTSLGWNGAGHAAHFLAHKEGIEACCGLVPAFGHATECFLAKGGCTHLSGPQGAALGCLIATLLAIATNTPEMLATLKADQLIRQARENAYGLAQAPVQQDMDTPHGVVQASSQTMAHSLVQPSFVQPNNHADREIANQTAALLEQVEQHYVSSTQLDHSMAARVTTSRMAPTYSQGI